MTDALYHKIKVAWIEVNQIPVPLTEPTRRESFSGKSRKNRAGRALSPDRRGEAPPLIGSADRPKLEAMAVISNQTADDERLAAIVSDRDRSDRAMRAAQDAFGQLYQRHARRLLAFLAARVPRCDLNDLHQEVWLRARRHLPSGFHGGNVRAWLHQIAQCPDQSLSPPPGRTPPR